MRVTELARFSDHDLQVVREELKEAAPILARAAGTPCEFLTADHQRAVYAVPQGFLTCEYRVTDADIILENLEYDEHMEREERREAIGQMVDAVMRDDPAAKPMLSRLIGESFEVVRAQQRAQGLVDKLQESLVERLTLVPEAEGPSCIPQSAYFGPENFPQLQRLPVLYERLNELLSDESADDDDLAEASYYSARGGRRVRRVRINRRARRTAKRTARRDRSKLLARLRKARRVLRRLASKPAFRRKVARVRSMNDASDARGVSEALLDIVRTYPQLGLLTTNDLEPVIAESLKLEGLEADRETVEETAEGLIRMSRHFAPELRRQLIDAARLYIKPYEQVGGDDMEDAIECSAWRLYEESDAREEQVSTTLDDVDQIVQELIGQIEGDYDPEAKDEDSEEMGKALKDLRKWAEAIGKMREEGEPDVKRLTAIVKDIGVMFGVDEEPEGEEDEGGPPENEDEGGEDEGGEDEGGEDEGGEDEGDEDEGDEDEGDEGDEDEGDEGDEEDEGEEDDEDKDKKPPKGGKRRARRPKKEKDEPEPEAEFEPEADAEGLEEGKKCKKRFASLERGQPFKFDLTEPAAGMKPGESYVKGEGLSYTEAATGVPFWMKDEWIEVLVDGEQSKNENSLQDPKSQVLDRQIFQKYGPKGTKITNQQADEIRKMYKDAGLDEMDAPIVGGAGGFMIEGASFPEIKPGEERALYGKMVKDVWKKYGKPGTKISDGEYDEIKGMFFDAGVTIGLPVDGEPGNYRITESCTNGDMVMMAEGWSCTAVADNALNKMVEMLRHRGKGDANNAWTWKGRTYFYEVDHSVEDGGISGEIQSYPGDAPEGSNTRREGTFRITDKGEVKRWPSATGRMKELAGQASARP